MPKFTISWGLGREDEDSIEITAASYDQAIVEAEQAALDLLDSYGGLHGYPCSEDFEEWQDFVDEAQSYISYSAGEVNE